MRTRILHVLALLLVTAPAIGRAQAPADAIMISAADIQAVLKHAADMKRTIPDNQVRVIDMGTYHLAIGVVHRGALGGPAQAGAGGGVQPAPSSQPACGEARPGATGPNGIFHDATAETYIVISGSGTLITGGTVVNGRRSAPESEVTTVLNGPSCSGTMVGYTSREIKEGDIIVIPERVAHGFTAIPNHITYLSVRPDVKKVLQRGYVNPGIAKR
jgi:mannose-6-phosphate isomerase-like protein (cupin superfamily)